MLKGQTFYKPTMLADIITVSRIPLSLLLLAFPPSSAVFAVLYLLCGVSDVLDGHIARRLHTESRKGEVLDSAADLFFASVYAVKLLPVLQIPLWGWIWTAFIALIKLFAILQGSRKKRRFYIPHSPANRLTGLLIFLLPLSVRITDIKYGTAVTCAAASFTAVKEIFGLKKYKNQDEMRKT